MCVCGVCVWCVCVCVPPIDVHTIYHVCCVIFKSSDVTDKGKAAEEETSSREASVEPAEEVVDVSH